MSVLQLRIKGRLYAFGAALAAGVAVAVTIGVLSFNQLHVGGPVYTKIVEGKDLVADILPPPAYVIEAYLEATLALDRAKPLADSRAGLKKLHDDYDDRRKYWQDSGLDGAIKQKLTQTSHAQVTRFWTAVEQNLMPALEKNDQAAAARAYADVTQAYQEHRKVIDAIVSDSEALNKSIESDAARQSSIVFWTVAAVIAGLFALLAIGIAMINRYVVKPIAGLTAVMTTVSGGNLKVEIPATGRADEVGEMANALLIFRDAAVEKLRLEGQTAEQREEAENERRRNEDMQTRAAEEQTRAVESLAHGLRSLSSGDLTFRLPDEFPEDYRQIRDDFNSAMSGLRDTIQAIATTTREVAVTAAEISTSTTNLSQRTEQQAAGLEETTASMEQISATVKKNAQNAQQADTFAASTRDVADRSGAVVAQAVGAMAKIEESSRKISDIISVIDEIARQTNLLALNAAVEAARAGEAGRGFAVVASEVRSLAQRSAQAAKDIKDLITSSSGQVQEGVELVNRAGGSLNDIVESIKKVAQIISEIAAASAEQSTGIDQVNTALTQMDEVTQQNSALVEENAAAAKSLEAQSQGMNERVSFFRLDGAQPGGRARTPVAARRRPAA
jgi:methyl-accepting chemotaxis protein